MSEIFKSILELVERKEIFISKLVHEGKYVAEVDIELIDTPEGWSPYLTVEDANKLDVVREALRKGDLDAASRLARLYTLPPVAL